MSCSDARLRRGIRRAAERSLDYAVPRTGGDACPATADGQAARRQERRPGRLHRRAADPPPGM